MTVRAMDRWEVREACEILSYHPHSNVSGLMNGYGDGAAQILYDGWTNDGTTGQGGMVYVHSLIPEPRFLTKGFLREMFRYAFGTVDWIVGVTPGFNKKALDFNKRLGFDVPLILPRGYAKDVDLYYQTMHYSTCRYWRRPEGALATTVKEIQS